MLRISGGNLNNSTFLLYPWNHKFNSTLIVLPIHSPKKFFNGILSKSNCYLALYFLFEKKEMSVQTSPMLKEKETLLSSLALHSVKSVPCMGSEWKRCALNPDNMIAMQNKLGNRSILIK